MSRRWLSRLGWVILGALLAAGAWALAKSERPGNSDAGFQPPIDAPRPIAAVDSVWMEDLTWMEIRDAMRSGATTAIVPTGGMEQNGPYVVTGKHNVILSGTAEAIARKLGNALVAPIIPFVPEGRIEPAEGHMRYPGTISLEQQTFESLVSDVARSLKAHGFTEIVLIGDSGGNQEGLAAVADKLDGQWRSEGVRVWHIGEYYDWDDRARWMRERGYEETEEGFHDELSVEAMMLAADPQSVRMRERLAAGKFSINGVPLAPAEKTAQLGRELRDYLADVTVAGIHQRRAGE